MGDIADAMLDGDLCQCCGVYMEGGNGYPQTCASCAREAKNYPQGRSAKVQCQFCRKTVTAIGLSQHLEAKHRAEWFASQANPQGEPK
jgi:hypothetical protein